MKKENEILRKKIIHESVARQELVISDFKQRIQDMMENEENVNEEEYDSHSQSFKEETTSEVTLLADELQLANHELEELQKIESYRDKHPHAEVEYGSVVRTDRGCFFVSASLEKFLVDGQPIIGVSVQSPIYREMRGKQVGETFSLNGIDYKIEEIF
jgi:hypothetical protein